MLSKVGLWSPRLVGLWIGLVFGLSNFLTIHLADELPSQLVRLSALACVLWWLVRPKWGFWVIGLWVLAQTFPTIPIPADVSILVTFLFAGAAGYGRRPLALGFVLITTPVTWLLGGEITLSDLLFWLGAFAVTAFLAWYGKVMEEREQAAEEKLKVVRQEAYLALAEDIHHTSARELTRVVMQSQHLRQLLTRQDQWDQEGRQAIIDELETQEATARSALAQARRAIEVFRAGPPELNPLQLRDEIRSRLQDLRRKGIEVDFQEPAWTFDDITCATLKMVLDEVLANLEKHGQTGTSATLGIEEEENGIVLTQTNLMAHPDLTPELSSGAGLELVAHRVETLGGTLTYRIRSGQWILNAVIPTSLATTE